jgi:hypothetical protein
VSLFDGLANRGRVHEARLFYLDSPLRALEDRRGLAHFAMPGEQNVPVPYPPTRTGAQYISIFPRGRRAFSIKNLDVRQWAVVLELLAEQCSLPVVIHGVEAEMTPIPAAENFIHPTDVLEQVHYLNNSRFCVSPDSGFVQFALNCGCDVFVVGGTIQYHQFADFNPFGTRLVIAGTEPQEYLPALKQFAATG